MGRKQNESLGFHDKTIVLMLYGTVLLVVIQNIKVFIGFASILAVIAATACWFRWYTKETAREKHLRSGVQEIEHMSKADFTKYIIVLFEHMGYKVQPPSSHSDDRTNLLLKKGTSSIAVQVAYLKNMVGAEAVQQAGIAKRCYRTNEAWVITNNTFTQSARRLAETNDVKLMDRSQLIQLISTRTSDIQTKETRPV